VQERSEIDLPPLSKKQINLLFFSCSIIALVLTGGGTLSWIVLNLYDYFVHGEYYYDCMDFYLPTFTKESFNDCKSTNFPLLFAQFAITTGLTTGLIQMAIKTRKEILRRDN